MDAALTPDLLQRLKEGSGSDVIEYLDLSNTLLVPSDLETLASCMIAHASKKGAPSPIVSLDLSGNLLCGVDEHQDGSYNVSGVAALVKAILSAGEKSPVCVHILFHAPTANELLVWAVVCSCESSLCTRTF